MVIYVHMKKINATKVRNNFFSILEDGYLKKEEYLIYKSGIPLMILTPYVGENIKLNVEKDLLRNIKRNRESSKVGTDSVDTLRNLRKKSA